jgi:hypothetical protein
MDRFRWHSVGPRRSNMGGYGYIGIVCRNHVTCYSVQIRRARTAQERRAATAWCWGFPKKPGRGRVRWLASAGLFQCVLDDPGARTVLIRGCFGASNELRVYRGVQEHRNMSRILLGAFLRNARIWVLLLQRAKNLFPNYCHVSVRKRSGRSNSEKPVNNSL